LRRKNPLRRIVPLACGARQKALPHARRARNSGAPRGNRNARKHGLFTTDAIVERKRIQDLLADRDIAAGTEMIWHGGESPGT